MEWELELVKTYVLWGVVVLTTFICILFMTTDVARSLLQLKIKRVFPVSSTPLTPQQIRLIEKKVRRDVAVLSKDLKEWKELKEERKLTECKQLITRVKEMEYLTQCKLLTNEQIREINAYMLNQKPIWKDTEVQQRRAA